MLKKTCLAACAAFVWAGTEIFALPIGNPLDASWLCTGVFLEGTCCDPCTPGLSWCEAWSGRIGFYGDYVFNRHLKVSQNEQDSSIRRTELYTNAAYLAFNVWNRIEIFGSLGASKMRLQTPDSAFLRVAGPNYALNIDIDSHFSWSLGGRGTIWECGCFGIGVEGQYFCFKSAINYLDNNFTEPVYLEDADIRYEEYQIGFGATYQIPIVGCGTFVVPYVGVKWAHPRLDMGNYTILDSEDNLVTLFNLKRQKDFGYAVGLTLVGSSRWSFTAEARFVDELALHINTQFRF
jgi:major outer membrane protein